MRIVKMKSIAKENIAKGRQGVLHEQRIKQ